MAGRKKEVQIQAEITSDEQWVEALSGPGLLVVDVYQKWCGPCKAVQNLFRKLRTEYGDDVLRFAMAEADSIFDLRSLKGKCQPVFLFYSENKLIAIIRGVQGPLLQKTTVELTEEEIKKQQLGSAYDCKVNELFLDDGPQTEKKSSAPDEVDINEVHIDEVDVDDQGLYYVVIIKPDAVAEKQVEEIKQKVAEAGYTVLAEEERILNEEQIQDFYPNRAGDTNFLTMMSSGLAHALILSKKGGQKEGDSVVFSDIIDTNQVELITTKKRSNGTPEGNIEISDDSNEIASRQLSFFFPSFSLNAEICTAKQYQKTLALIRPSLLQERKDEILQTIRESGFQVAMQREITLTEEQAKEFYKEHEGAEHFPCLIKHMTSGPVLALALTREDAVQHWRNLLGPKILQEAKEKYPESLRARFAIEDMDINQLHGSSTVEEAERDLTLFFPVEHTLGVIKPDASQEHKDDIVKRIKEAGFIISQIKETHLTREMAETFYRDHKGKDFFNPLVDHMSQGACVMMILSKENAVAEWRKLMGPTDPELARECTPGSIRAQFAKSILENAVHGSSNAQHAMNNIKFIFGGDVM